MDSDSDSDRSHSKGDFSRFSMHDENSTDSDSSTGLTKRKVTSSKLNETADESIIVKPKKNTKQQIFESDSDSDSDRESAVNKLESDDEDSDEKSNHLGSNVEDENENDGENDKSKEAEHTSGVGENTSMVYQNSHSDKSGGDSKKAFDSYRSRGKSESYDSNESDDSYVETSKSSLSQSVVIPETDEEDDDFVDEMEVSQIHVFSPRTRRSITGRRSNAFARVESDDDEIISNETSQSRSSQFKSAESSKVDSSIDEYEHIKSEQIKRNRSIAPNESISTKTPNAKRQSVNMSNVSSAPTTSTPSRSTPNIEFSDRSDESGMSGIQIQSSHSENEMKSTLNESSVVLLNSSDEENHASFANSTTLNFKSINSSTPGPSTSKMVQPKLQFGQSSQKSKKLFVSRDFYNKKNDELLRERSELKDNENLLANMGKSLPDKGRNLENRIRDLKRGISEKELQLEKYAIEEDHLDEIQIVEPTNNNLVKNAINWRDDLENIQPRWTGQQGLSTFNTQKTLTLNRIEKLHKAMEKCPAETELARQPDHLNVQLMQHQLHAIKWMRWRESQKPKGGLLADDMGLGKTLTVIGLVLDSKYGKNLSMVEEKGENDDTEDEDESDDENDRGYKKHYSQEGGTLIVCPASLINQWEHEIENRVKRRKLTVLMHHGNKRKESFRMIGKYDLVITTYGIVSSEHKTTGSLFRIRWNRIVLDEAHMIRNHSTAVSKGCCSLRSTLRWGLTGTPIQNKHMDVYSMLKFLRVTPFDDLATFKKWIDPKTEAGMKRLHNILKPLLLRRTKAELQIKGELQALPSKSIVIEDIELSPAEANVYTRILAYSQSLFAQYMDQHQQRNGGGKMQLNPEVQRRLDQVKRFGGAQEVKSSTILVLLLRLRQICDHPGLINQMLQDECDVEDAQDEEFDALDMNIVKQMIGLKINENDRENEDGNSSEEETDSKNVLVATSKVYDFERPSSKCKRVIDIVKRITRDTSDKIVIVSQWTSFLNIVSKFLLREKVHYVELTGKTPIKDRNDIVVSFNNPNSSERVMMLSLVAGGVGLNLTGANHLILLDPHWNPQLESQAFDRVYRVGQSKDVQIYKLLCVKTVEKHIQGIQDNKLALSDNVLTGSKSTGSKLSMQDMRQLFEL